MRRFSLLVAVLSAVLLVMAGSAWAAGPSAMTQPATQITTTSAVLNATVNPAGQVVLSCSFQWGTDTNYTGGTLPCSPTPSGSAAVNTGALLNNLAPGTTYHYRVVLATLQALLPVTGSDVSFQTLTASKGQVPVVTTAPAQPVYSTSATLNGTVNPGNEALTACTFHYGTTAVSLTQTAPCATTPSGGTATPVSADITGLTPSTTYYYTLSATNASGTGTSGQPPASFATPASGTAPSPVVTTGTGSATSGSTATLDGTVDPNGGTVTSCTFEYGTTTSYGASVPCSATPSGSGPQQVSADVTGLSPGTTYHFQLVAQDAADGAATPGGDANFSTPPIGTASTGSPSGITATTATLQGTVNPQGQTVRSCNFYLGTGSGFQQALPCAPTVSAGSSDQAVSARATGLKPTTTYHEVVVLQTVNGYALGGIVTFTTAAEPTGGTTRATRVTETTATLHGFVNPHGGTAVTCVFEYGVMPFSTSGSNTYSLSVPCAPTPSGSTNVSVSAQLLHIAAHTTYYYRVLVRTDAGFLIGNTMSFRTASTRVVQRPGVRLTRVRLNRRAHSALFAFRATGARATRFGCALVRVGRGGRLGRVRYARCRSPKLYRHLRHGRYAFLVRAGNAGRFGRPVVRRFTV